MRNPVNCVTPPGKGAFQSVFRSEDKICADSDSTNGTRCVTAERPPRRSSPTGRVRVARVLTHHSWVMNDGRADGQSTSAFQRGSTTHHRNSLPAGHGVRAGTTSGPGSLKL